MPVFLALGEHHTFLTAEEAARVSPEERIRSVWPLVAKKVRRFVATLSAREKCNFDAEDLLLECWIALRERDHKWSPARGRYVSFAAPIVHNCLYRLRELARTVESAKNTSCRIKEYRRDAANGTLSDARRQTMERMGKAAEGSRGFTDTGRRRAHGGMPGRAACVARAEPDDGELAAAARAAVITAICQLTPYEAVVAGASLGLWGKPARTVAQVARDAGRTRDSVRRTAARAEHKIRAYLALAHPGGGI